MDNGIEFGEFVEGFGFGWSFCGLAWDRLGLPPLEIEFGDLG